MTPKNKEQVMEAARQAGIDLDLLEANLALSVKERWEQHDAAWNLARQLQEAREKSHAQLQPAAHPAD